VIWPATYGYSAVSQQQAVAPGIRAAASPVVRSGNSPLASNSSAYSTGGLKSRRFSYRRPSTPRRREPVVRAMLPRLILSARDSRKSTCSATQTTCGTPCTSGPGYQRRASPQISGSLFNHRSNLPHNLRADELVTSESPIHSLFPVGAHRMLLLMSNNVKTYGAPP